MSHSSNTGSARGPQSLPGAGQRIDTDYFPPGVPQAMAHISKRGFFSSLFGNKKQKEDQQTADLESRHRLEERIQQVLAERAVVRELLIEEKNEKNAALMMREEEPEPEVELFPISASVLPIRKAPVQSAFVLPAFEVPRSYASNRR